MGVRRISKNIVALAAAEIVSKALQFVLLVYAARMLGSISFGKFSFALAFSMIAVIFADFGINALLIREIARKKSAAGKYFVNGALAKAAFSTLTFIAAAVLLNLMGYPAITRKVTYIILLFALMSSFTDLLYSVFRAFERMEFDAMLKIARMIILTALGLWVLFNGYGVVAFSLMFLLAEIIVFLIALRIGLARFVKPTAPEAEFARKIAKKAFPFGLAVVFGSIYFYIDSVMLSAMKGDLEVGIYSVAYNIVIALLFIPTIYTNAIYPALSRYYRTSKEKLIFIYRKSFKYLYIIGLPLSAALFLLADKIIALFYTAEYHASTIALKIIGWFVFIKFLNFLTGIVLYSIDRQKQRMVSQGLTAAFNVVLNLLLIPPLGFIGAAIATFATEIFLFALYYGFVSRNLYALNFFPLLPKPIIATLIMAACLNYIKLNLVILVPSAVLLYAAALLALGAFDKEDKGLILKVMKND
jgi:O-antigen/teichoic acid export membrane protein